MEIRLCRVAIRIAFIYLAIGGTCESLQAKTELRFRLVNSTLIVVSLSSGQSGSFDFVLDTGADTTVVDPLIASRLSFVPTDRIEEVTLSGMRLVPHGFIPSLSVGPSRMEKVPVLLQDLSELRRLDSHIEGIVGQDLLSHFNYLLDYRKHVVSIESDNEIRDGIDGDRVAIDSTENRMMVASEAQSRGGATLRLVIDSGANSLVLLRAASQTLNLPRQETSLEVTPNGQVWLQMGRVRLLTVGSQVFHDVCAFLPAVEPGVRMGDGLLPTTLFQAVYVNNRERFVVFNPRAKKS